MLTSRTFILEITGILGAGYPPGLFKPLTAYLRSNHAVIHEGRGRRLVTRYHLDNTGVLKEDATTQARVIDLITRANYPPTFEEHEWRDLCELLSQSERRFLSDLGRFPEPIDVAFRRGGRLQDHILFHRAPDRVAAVRRDPRTTPKLQIFLRADIDTIRAAHEDPHLQKLIADNPGIYSATPESAFSMQEEWLKRVRHLTGLHYFERREVSADAFAQSIADHLIPFFEAFGLNVVPSNRPHDIFVSYAWEDREYAQRLAHALGREGLRVWFDASELTPGDSLIEKLSEGISKARRVALVLSTSYLAKPWTSWAKQELKGFFARETSGERVLVPIWLGISKDDVLRFSPPLADVVAIVDTDGSVSEVAERLARSIKTRRRGNT